MLKLAICQIMTETDFTLTMQKTEEMLRRAATAGTDFAVLPEMFVCPYSGRSFKGFAEIGHETVLKQMSALAKELGIYIVAGSVPEKDGDKLFNTCFVFDRQGRQIARHRKLHLFDCNLPGLSVHESRTFSAGDSITVFDTEYGKMGCVVCFDVRFPELFRAMAMRGARLVFIPAQFNMITGPANWSLLLRARAADQQIFTVGASAARNRALSYQCWGHSTVVDPMGRILCECDDEEEILFADIELDDVAQANMRLPLRSSMRSDLYAVTE